MSLRERGRRGGGEGGRRGKLITRLAGAICSMQLLQPRDGHPTYIGDEPHLRRKQHAMRPAGLDMVWWATTMEQLAAGSTKCDTERSGDYAPD